MSYSSKLYTKCFKSVLRLNQHWNCYRIKFCSTIPQLEHHINTCKFLSPAWDNSRRYCSLAPDLWEPGYASKYCPPSPNELVERSMKDKFQDKTEFSFEEWEEFRTQMLDHFYLLTEVNFDSITMTALLSCNNIFLAQSFMKYLKKLCVKPNLVTNSKYMILCSKNPEHSSQEEVMNTYSNIKSTLDLAPVLDNITVNCVIHGLCMTEDWRKSFEYLKKLPLKNPHYDTKNAIAIAALKNDDEALGWNIITTWYGSAAVAGNNVFAEYARLALRTSYRDSNKATVLMTKLLEFLQARNILPDVTLTKEIRNFFLCHNKGWEIKESKINRSAICSTCSKTLRSAELTVKAFESLKVSFFEKSLYKSDIFINTTRDELGKFVMFVDKRKPFDFVVDGLNTASVSDERKSRKDKALQLLEVIDKLSARSNRILILGRQHMKGWPNDLMNRIRRKASLFLTRNTSQDDPFLIYAALASGPNSFLVSSDLMRDHMSRLNDPVLIKIFNRWQQSHQIYVTSENDNTRLTGPLKHSICIQGSMHEGWHIPYDNAFILEPYETLNNWLCVQPAATEKDCDIDINSFYK